MEKLTLIHIKNHIGCDVKTPYGIGELIGVVTRNKKIKVFVDYRNHKNLGYTDDNGVEYEYIYLETQCDIEEIQLILHPLSDLTMNFYWNNLKEGDFELNEDKIKEMIEEPRGWRKYYQYLYLSKHHFDLSGLIPKELALDIKKFKKLRHFIIKK